MNGYLQAWRRYATFRGRATRREFWGFLLLHVLAILLISFLERQFAIANPEIGMGNLTGLYLLASFLPALAVTVRRLHDSGLRGWWVLFCVVPRYLVHGWSGHGVAQTVRIGKAISDDITGRNDDFTMLTRIEHDVIPLGNYLGPVAIPLVKGALSLKSLVNPTEMVSF